MKIMVVMMEENIFGREVLRALIQYGFHISGIVIEKGSKQAEKIKEYLENPFYNPPTFTELVTQNQLSVVTVQNLNDESTIDILSLLAPDYICLGGSSRILKQDFLDTAQRAILNTHPGLLPWYRGMDPILWSLYNGDPVGATCHIVDNGIDTGPICAQKEISLKANETLLELRVRVMRISIELMARSLEGLVERTLKPIPQATFSGASYKRMPEELKRVVEQKLG
jgi:methionyl-tRNA formyltransferase